MSKKDQETRCKCPYCDREMPITANLCDVCKIRFIECKNCGKKFSDKLDKCPNCGMEVGRDG